MTILVSFSGGIDSTAALCRAVRRVGTENVLACSIDYGQSHVKELEAAHAVAEYLDVPQVVLDLRGLLYGSSLLGEEPVPHGSYDSTNMASTVVRGRNLLFASAIIAKAQPGDTVMLGVHSGDHHIYPDCRPEFITYLRSVASVYEIGIDAPWLHMSKAEIIATEPHAPYRLTWSCYEGGDLHCGQCATCHERSDAFNSLDLTDPTQYRETP